jgi:hypothetical protein
MPLIYQRVFLNEHSALEATDSFRNDERLDRSNNLFNQD